MRATSRLLTGMTGILRPMHSMALRDGARKFSSAAPNLIPIKDVGKFKLSDDYLSKTTFGSEEVNIASHDVRRAKGIEDGLDYVVKAMSQARVGEEGEVMEYSSEESKEQAVLEVLATKVGKILLPSQFPDAEVAVDNEGNHSVVTKFIPNTVSVRELRARLGMVPDDRDESIFSLKRVGNVPLRTTVDIPQDMYVENIKLSSDLKSMMKRDGYTIADALLSGRIDLKLALYILGEKDEVLNRDGNTLLAIKGYNIDQDNKVITPELRPIAIDCGLCFGRGATKDIINQAFKLAIRESDSHQMGLELDGKPPTNLKPIKDSFLEKVIKVYESGKVDQLIDSASKHLSEPNMELVHAMKERLTICYLAGKCVKNGLDSPEKEQEAKTFLKEQLNLLQKPSVSSSMSR